MTQYSEYNNQENNPTVFYISQYLPHKNTMQIKPYSDVMSFIQMLGAILCLQLTLPTDAMCIFNTEFMHFFSFKFAEVKFK